jgi:molecular chaperone DnaK
MSSDWHLGIDFGTSFTVVAASRDGTATVIDVESNGSSRMPSSVFFTQDEEFLVGTAALHQAVFNPERFEPTPKRAIGEGEIFLGDQLVPVVDLVAAVLRRVYSEACRQQGETVPATVCVTHPADWSATRLNVLREAIEKSGMRAATLVPEPVAAATRFAMATPMGKCIAVYDFGGGTMDAAVLRRTDQDFTVAGQPAGRDPLGGEDIDRRIIDYVGTLVGEEDPDWLALLDAENTKDRHNAATLRAEVRRAKETLSEVSACQLWLPGLERAIQLTRVELEGLIASDVDATVDTLQRALEDAHETPADLAGIYLIGGSSRIPLVADTIWRRLEVRPVVQDNPKSVVALGASGWDPASRPKPARRAVPPPPPPPPPPGSSGAGAAKAAHRASRPPVPPPPPPPPRSGPHAGAVPSPARGVTPAGGVPVAPAAAAGAGAAADAVATPPRVSPPIPSPAAPPAHPPARPTQPPAQPAQQVAPPARPTQQVAPPARPTQPPAQPAQQVAPPARPTQQSQPTRPAQQAPPTRPAQQAPVPTGPPPARQASPAQQVPPAQAQMSESASSYVVTLQRSWRMSVPQHFEPFELVELSVADGRPIEIGQVMARARSLAGGGQVWEVRATCAGKVWHVAASAGSRVGLDDPLMLVAPVTAYTIDGPRPHLAGPGGLALTISRQGQADPGVTSFALDFLNRRFFLWANASFFFPAVPGTHLVRVQAYAGSTPLFSTSTSIVVRPSANTQLTFEVMPGQRARFR